MEMGKSDAVWQSEADVRGRGLGSQDQIGGVQARSGDASLAGADGKHARLGGHRLKCSAVKPAKARYEATFSLIC